MTSILDIAIGLTTDWSLAKQGTEDGSIKDGDVDGAMEITYRVLATKKEQMRGHQPTGEILINQTLTKNGMLTHKEILWQCFPIPA